MHGPVEAALALLYALLARYSWSAGSGRILCGLPAFPGKSGMLVRADESSLRLPFLDGDQLSPGFAKRRLLTIRCGRSTLLRVLFRSKQSNGANPGGRLQSPGWPLRCCLRLGRAAPYKHFPDKSALLAELAIQGFEQLGREMTAAVTPRPRSIRKECTVSRCYRSTDCCCRRRSEVIPLVPH
jgi:hypothetical protein